MSERRGSRPPRPSGGPGARRSDGRSRSGAGRPGARRPGDRRQSPDRRRPLTAAERRAAEVRATRAPRPERDPERERERIESRATEQWIDEGSSDEVAALRRQAAGAAERGSQQPRRRKGPRPLDPSVVAAIAAASDDRQKAERLATKLAETFNALDHDRLDEARRLVMPLLRQLPDVPAVHEAGGLVYYRLGRWPDAVRELEAAQLLSGNVDLLPVLADCYRALRRWADVDRLWGEIREVSPSPDVMAEGRIVAAGARADRGDITGALAVMAKAGGRPKRVREHHLRQWYVLGDLHDRAGNPIEAARSFQLIVDHDADFADAALRLRSLGR